MKGMEVFGLVRGKVGNKMYKIVNGKQVVEDLPIKIKQRRPKKEVVSKKV